MSFRPTELHGSAHTIAIDGELRLPEVLVVDDSKEIRDVIVLVLRVAGYRATLAQNGEEAKAHLSTMHPALIITDLRMPVCDGWSLLAFCHTHHTEVPVLIVSGEPFGERPEVEAWAAAFVMKPFDPKNLQSEVNRLLSRTAPRSAFQNVRSA